MSDYVAFLRAINIGGHIVKMETLKQVFEQLGFSNVESFIASGNMIFDTVLTETAELEKTIQTALREALGYDVAVFIRTSQEVASIAGYQPFPAPILNAATALNVAFLSFSPDPQAITKLMSLKTDIDDFNIHEREIYWLCKKKQSESTFSNAVLEKVLGRQSTLRGINTIKKLTDKYHFS